MLSAPRGTDPRDYYAALGSNEADLSPAQVYGRALAQMLGGDAAGGDPDVREAARRRTPACMMFHTALGQAQLAAGDTRAALETLERARNLAPRNVPVTVRYGEALMQAGRPKRAHEVLLDLFNNVPPTPGTDPADGDGGERGGRRRRRLLVHGRVPPHGRRPAARDQPARTGAVRAEHFRRAALEVRRAPEGTARMAAERAQPAEAAAERDCRADRAVKDET